MCISRGGICLSRFSMCLHTAAPARLLAGYPDHSGARSVGLVRRSQSLLGFAVLRCIFILCMATTYKTRNTQMIFIFFTRARSIDYPVSAFALLPVLWSGAARSRGAGTPPAAWAGPGLETGRPSALCRASAVPALPPSPPGFGAPSVAVGSWGPQSVCFKVVK